MKSIEDFVTIINEEQTLPDVKWMEEHYQKYNKELFNNELPKKIELGLIRDKKIEALGWQGVRKKFYTNKDIKKDDMYKMMVAKPNPKYERGYRGEIVPTLDSVEDVTDIAVLDPFIELNTMYKFSPYQKEDTMIHEMIHLWVSRNGLNPKQAHGKEFRKKCNETRALAKKLYGIEYMLTTYAPPESDDPDKGYSRADKIFIKDKIDKQDKSISKDLLDDIKKAAKKGGGVRTVYYKVNRKENPHRYVFVTYRMLPRIIDEIYNLHKYDLEEIRVTADTYEKCCIIKNDKLGTQNKMGTYWYITNIEKSKIFKLITENTENIYRNPLKGGKRRYESKLSLTDYIISEGLVSTIKKWVKKFMNWFVEIKGGTPTSEINMEDILNDAEEEYSEEVEGTLGPGRN